MIFTYKKKIYGYECDIYGHLNNANYLQMLEAARSEAMIVMDIPLARMNDMGIQFFVYRVEMDYLKALDLEETVTVKSCFFEVNRLKGKWKQEVYNSKDEKCFQAIITVVHASEGKAKRLPVKEYELIASFVELD
jgi:YbgC/YbaW family acyl-CoA thioester hydrolase